MPRDRILRVGASLAVCLCLAGQAPKPAPKPASKPVPARPAPPAALGPRVAVLPFGGGVGPEQEEIGVALQAMLITDLAVVPGLRLLERTHIKDLMAEQEFGLSGAVDPRTAARAGKLLGASHLLVGRCTVAGERMRLDARLLKADAGDVVVAASIEGDKEAFFELEKDLVNRLVAAMGVKLLPKERAEIAKVHTADYEAFRTFGKGLRLYDAKEMEPALAALREAVAKDQEFKLASLTLEEYERILVAMRSRAEDLQVAQARLERAKQDKAAAAEAALVERLQKLASGTDRNDRLTALHSLAVALGNLGTRKNKLMHLRNVEDRFALCRQAEAVAARYVEEALAAFPAAPVTVDESRYAFGLTENLDDFDREWAWAKRRLLGVGDTEENRRAAVMDSTRRVGATAGLLHMDFRQMVAFRQQLFDMSLRLQPSPDEIQEGRESLAKLWRDALELDRSNALLQELSRGVDNPWRLKSLAAEIEENRDRAKVLALSPTPDLAREYLLLVDRTDGLAGADRFFSKRPPTQEACQALTRRRTWPRDFYLWVGNQPCWSINGTSNLYTGARTDHYRTSELRMWLPPTHDAGHDPLIVLGAAPRKEFTATFTLDHAVPSDFRPFRPPDPAAALRPEVSFLFGLEDVDCGKVEDPVTKQRTVSRPMKGFAIVFGKTSVSLAEIRETERDMWDRKVGFEIREVAARPLAERGTVTVKLAGSRLTVEAGGRQASFSVKPGVTGYTGLWVRGSGYVSFRDLKMAVPKS